MHCPRCGSPLEAGANGSLFCTQTGAHLSRDFLEELAGYRLPADEPRVASPMTCDPEGTWFCPDCGCELERSPGFVDCPECGQGFNGFVNALLKSNPHP